MATRAARRAATVRVWEDDPMSAGAAPVERPVPKLPTGRLKVTIDGPAPDPGPAEPGSADFRYWTAADALARGVRFWAPLLPRNVGWVSGKALAVQLDAGDRLNALYNRTGLMFFHATVGGTTVFTGESPDVVCHELGHAVLDAIRPQLWDAMTHEVAAFHESFGDISAILTGLQLPSVRDHAIAETTGRYRASRLSRVAEQLGWGARHRRPCGVDADCLRNAVNCFAYQPPDQLPLLAPASTLSSEAHNFSRVFTGAFFEAFAGMVVTLNVQPTADTLLEASTDAGRLLVAAVRAAPVTPAYFTQVAGHLLQADLDLFGGRYGDALRFGFMARAILSPESAASSGSASAAAALRAAGARPPAPAELPALTLPGRELGLGDRPVLVRAPTETPRLAVSAAALDGSPSPSMSGERAARAFLSELLLRDRIHVPTRSPDDGRLRTHAVLEEGDALVVVRRLFDASPAA